MRENRLTCNTRGQPNPFCTHEIGSILSSDPFEVSVCLFVYGRQNPFCTHRTGSILSSDPLGVCLSVCLRGVAGVGSADRMQSCRTLGSSRWSSLGLAHARHRLPRHPSLRRLRQRLRRVLGSYIYDWARCLISKNSTVYSSVTLRDQPMSRSAPVEATMLRTASSCGLAFVCAW